MAKFLQRTGCFKVSRNLLALNPHSSDHCTDDSRKLRETEKLLFLTVDFNCGTWSNIPVQEITFFLVPEPYEEVINT
jgi:hypothetical protein